MRPMEWQGATTQRGSGSYIQMMTAALLRLWDNVLYALAAVAGIAGVSGFLLALAMPRGPITAPQALVVVLSGLAIGVAGGFLARSRWAMLVAPVAYVLTFEIGRLDASGPTVDGIVLGSTYGVLALILGRGVHGILGLLPMVLGVAYGAALARRLSGVPSGERSPLGSAWFYTRRGVAGLATIGVVALAVWIMLPASTPAITDADGNVVVGSIAELEKVELGGADQWIMVRGASEDNPVILYLSGGPGQSDLPFPRALFLELTEDFTFVGWDQRGAGKSYPALEPIEDLTLEQAIADTIELTDYLRQRFDEEKIYLMGESWGTLLGVLTVQQRPDLFHAYIGSGQMVNPLETDRGIRQELIAYGERIGDESIVDQMEEYGEPPYDDVFAYGYVLSYYDALAGDYSPPELYEERGTEAGIGPFGVFASEYSAIEKVNVLRGLLDMFSVMYPQLQEIDLREDAPQLDVPVYLLDGGHELKSRRDLAFDWFEMLDAPEKQIYTFENGGHSVAFEHFEETTRILVEEVLPATYR